MLKKGEEPIPGYVLEKSLGHGAFGVVWRARGPGNTHCALKFISLDAKSGHKELRAIDRVKDIRHANLLSITAFWILDDEGMLVPVEVIARITGKADPAKPAVQGTMTPQVRAATLIIAMPLGDKNLADRLSECVQAGKSGIPAEELLEYIEEAAKAIDFLNAQRHDLGEGPVAIQHCDIKPANIMIVGSAAQVCDFGLARVLGSRGHSSTRGASGTPAYMAPEVIVDERPTATTDQYSLALTYYELRTGRLPFGDVESLTQVLEAHTKGTLDFAGLSAEERQVVARGAHRTPSSRFPSTLAFARALRAAAASVETAVPLKAMAASTATPDIAGTLDLPVLAEAVPDDDTTRHSAEDAKASRSTASIRAEIVDTRPNDSLPSPAAARPRPVPPRATRPSNSSTWIVLSLGIFGLLVFLSLAGWVLLLYQGDRSRDRFDQVTNPYFAPPSGDDVPGTNPPGIVPQPLIVPQSEIVPPPGIVPPPVAPPGNDDVPSN